MMELRWTGIALALGLCLAALLWVTRGWIWLGVPPINPERTPASDTAAHIGTAINCADGLGEWHGRVCFVPDIATVPRAQTYEPWLTFHRWGLDHDANVTMIAVLMIALFYLAICLAFKPRTPVGALLVLALLFTPAVQLCVERGNFDLLIAALLCLAGRLLAKTRSGGAIGSIAVLSFATMLKIYTGLACALAWLISPVRWRVSMPAAAFGVVAAVSVIGVRELRALGQGAPEGETRFSTGARWLFEQMGAGAGMTAAVLAALACLLAWRLMRHVPAEAFSRWPRRTAVFQLAFLTAVPLFLLKNSYDYRFVLWLPCLALPFAWLTANGAGHRILRGLAASMFAMFLLAAGMELPLTWLDKWHGAAPAASIAVVLVFLKQLATWLLAAVFAAVFARSVVPRFQPFVTGQGFGKAH